MSPTRSLAALVACVALVLGACGSDDSDDADADPTTTAADSDAGVGDAADSSTDGAGAGDDGDGDDGDGSTDDADADGASDDDDGDDEGDGGAADGGAGSGGEGRPTSAGIDPCAVLDAEDVGEAFGIDLTETRELTGERTVQGVTWTTIACDWSSDAGDDVTAAVAGPDEFEAGFTCAEPVGVVDEPTPVDGLGDQAWWTWDDFQGGKGDLAVCAGERRIDITVEGPREGPILDEDQVREGSIAVAEALLP